MMMNMMDKKKMMKVSTSGLGFPRMGPNREMKFALEKHWQGSVSEMELKQVAYNIEDQGWNIQKESGIDRITVGDHYLYDAVLQWTEMLGIVPQRFLIPTMEEGTTKTTSNTSSSTMKSNQSKAVLPAPGLPRMFAMARGIDGAPALSMKKWITSNYHYMVPEFDETTKINPDFSWFLDSIQRGKDILGPDCATPVVLGPVSFARLTKISAGTKMTLSGLVEALIPVYTHLLNQISMMGFTEVQIHEPVLVFAERELNPIFAMAYPHIIQDVSQKMSVNLVSFMDDVGEENFQWLIAQPEIRIISMDFTTARGGHSLDFIAKYGFPTNKTLGVGIIDARNVWKIVPTEISPILDNLNLLGVSNVRIQPSGSLQYCPWDFERETELQSHPAAGVLAFAKQKLDEVVLVAKTLSSQSIVWSHHETAWKEFHKKRLFLASSHAVVALGRLKNLTDKDLIRQEEYKTRRPKQLVGLPALPTTTIGSFPQTAEIRSLRAQWNKGLLSDEEYKAGIDRQIAFCIGVQEAIGLDVLVHGEAERTDMVEFFAQQMEGMLFTSHGWVQSFGSRCVRPPILWNDITRPKAMTTREFMVAQKLTKKPVKGMLTGPITILNWSFPRVDISRNEQAFQIGLCIRDEISDLEAAGCLVVQVDEPALREGMPLRSGAKEEYLKWAVDAFRLATAGAKNETQVQTHMCYCEFNDCMNAIDRMDTDVNSIENARSDNATLEAFRSFGYAKGFGPGTYDIHSPVIPTLDAQKQKIESFLEVLEADQCVVNPDCGLKTRKWPETISALRNMVAATEMVRAERGLI